MGKLTETLEDDELGVIRVKVHPQARRFIFRTEAQGLVVTCSPRSSMGDLARAVEELRPRLQQLLQRNTLRQERKVLTPETEIGNDLFRMGWRPGLVSRLTARHLTGSLEVVYPSGQDWQAAGVQEWLLAQVERNLALQAKRSLVPRLAELAELHGFRYARAAIHKTRSRWGSCSSRGNINLSVYLTLLPPHLRDYVMLHELCHTREMNHSPRFWALLDQVVEGRNEAYRQEMKGYETSVFPFRPLP